jgi:hypothetical protein
MSLPNAEEAQVDSKKITEYLLSANHPDGHSKAEFFTRFGFRPENWQVLMEALRQHVVNGQVVVVVESPYGARYIVEGELETPDARNTRLRTVWIIEAGGTTPRLITAYPARRQHAEGT